MVIKAALLEKSIPTIAITKENINKALGILMPHIYAPYIDPIAYNTVNAKETTCMLFFLIKTYNSIWLIKRVGIRYSEIPMRADLTELK